MLLLTFGARVKCLNACVLLGQKMLPTGKPIANSHQNALNNLDDIFFALLVLSSHRSGSLSLGLRADSL